MQQKFHYRDFLKKALEQRQSRNPSYSVGSFGRLLGLEASRMGQILNGKVGISVKRALSISDSLNLSENDKKLFILSVQAEQERSPVIRKRAIENLEKHFDEYKNLDDIISSIQDWYHYAVIEYITLPEKNHTNEAIAKYFGISGSIVDQAIKRLLDLQLIVIEPCDTLKYVTTSFNRRTGQDIPTEAVKVLNEQILEKAAYELRNQEISNRDYSMIFLKLNKEQLEKAKDRIRDFRRDFLIEFESAPDKNAIYCMGVQFFELGNK